MRLSDRDIHSYLEDGELVVFGPRPEYPFDAARQIQPCSIDLRLDSHFFKFRDEVQSFDVKDLGKITDYIESFRVEDKQPISIPPGSVLFGQIYEQLRLPAIVSGKIVSRSRFARLGLAVHATGDFINPEFEGAMPLQLINHNRFPVVIYPMLTICQLVLVQLSSKPITSYPMRSDNPYHREREASPSVLHHDPILRTGSKKALADEIQERMLENYRRRRASSTLVHDVSSFFESKLQRVTDQPKFVISNSNIGVLNTESEIGSATAMLNARTEAIGTETARLLHNVLEFLTNDTNGLDAHARDEIASIVRDIVSEASLPAGKQPSQSSLRAMLGRLGEVLKTSAAGSTLWQHWGPQLLALFS